MAMINFDEGVWCGCAYIINYLLHDYHLLAALLLDFFGRHVVVIRVLFMNNHLNYMYLIMVLRHC